MCISRAVPVSDSVGIFSILIIVSKKVTLILRSTEKIDDMRGHRGEDKKIYQFIFLIQKTTNKKIRQYIYRNWAKLRCTVGLQIDI